MSRLQGVEALKKIGSFLKIEHTLFSLPLLFAGALLAPGVELANPPWGRLGWIALAGTGARTAALALNRILDRHLDALNPRTAARELPSGALGLGWAWGVAGAGLVMYAGAAWALGPLCLALSPVPLLLFAVYPLLKRFTWLCHFGVGLALAMAPMGGYIGACGCWPEGTALWWLAGFALCWVAGFDALYAILDEAFDRSHGLHSVPAQFGAPAAQDLSMLLHALAFFCLAVLRWEAFADKPAWIWMALAPAGVLLALEQHFGYSLEKDSPFFKINAWTSAAALLWVLAGKA